MSRPAFIPHSTSEPIELFGRADELRLLDEAMSESGPSVVSLIGPGGQGKTAIVQTWLRRLRVPVAGVFLWSFYRGKDADVCLRRWLAYAEGRDDLPDVSASFAAQRVIEILRRERWAVVLDGAEVVQHEDGDWHGRFTHPDLGALLIELATQPMPGVVALTSRFAVPELTRRPHHRSVSLDRLDADAARGLLSRLGVRGDLDGIADAAGRHAKAVELLGTLIVHFGVSPDTLEGDADDVEAAVGRVLSAYRRVLSEEQGDVIALATAFREPPTEALLLQYLTSESVRVLLRDKWERRYPPFDERVANILEELVQLRLLERVAPGVIDAHPLVRRGFEHGQTAGARAGFLRGRPDRRRAATLDEARPAIELFHALLDAGLFNEADGVFVGLESPKSRFLAPALERDLLLRFFPGGDLRKPPLWSGFGRRRALAISLELLGRYEEALAVYLPIDAGLRGDALLALGRVAEVASVVHVPAPWQGLWRAYRAHALCLLGRVEEAVSMARSLLPQDVYEWVHVFECLLRAGRLVGFDLRGLSAPQDQVWAGLACRRMHADLRRINEPGVDLRDEYHALIEAYDRAGLAYERVLTRLSLAAHVPSEATAIMRVAISLIEQCNLAGLAGDAWTLLGDEAEANRWRVKTGILGPVRR